MHKKNPRQVWNNLTEHYPEVVQKTDNLKFPGAGQRLTPVANRENLLYILGLLPGAVGRTYREEAAKLMLMWLDAPAELAVKAIGRVENEEDLKKVRESTESRAKYLNAHHGSHDMFRDRQFKPHHYKNYNGSVNRAVGLPTGEGHRKNMNDMQEAK